MDSFARELGRAKRPFGGTERRCEARTPFYCPLEFVLKSAPDKILRGAVRDVTMLGLGITSYAELRQGQEIVIKSIVPTSYREYVVRWAIRVREDLFSVGLRAIE